VLVRRAAQPLHDHAPRRQLGHLRPCIAINHVGAQALLQQELAGGYSALYEARGGRQCMLLRDAEDMLVAEYVPLSCW